MREEDAAEDDAGGVDQWGEGLEGELFANESDGGEDTADEEEDLAGKENARHGGAKGDDGRIVWAEVARVPRDEELSEAETGRKDERDGGEDDGEGTVACFDLAALAIAGEDGDEGDGSGTADEEAGDEVGKLEGDVVSVRCGAGAEGVGDVFIANEADNAGEQSEKAEQQGSGGGGVLVGRAKETETAAVCDGAWGRGGDGCGGHGDPIKRAWGLRAASCLLCGCREKGDGRL